jgi:hypothetical protein
VDKPDTVVLQILQYAGKSMEDFPRPRNPCLTARETIVIADFICKLLAVQDEKDNKIAELTHERDKFQVMAGANGLAGLAVGKENDALRAEVERLTGCLKRANDQAEEFERRWYLRGDDVERLRAVFSDLIAGLDKTHWSSWQSTAHFYEAYHSARAALQEPTP